MRDIYRQTHICEMKSVAQRNQGETNNMVSDQLFEIFPRLLHPQHKDDCLLTPVCRLKQVIEFENTLVRLVWEAFIHSPGVEIPDRCSAHNIHAGRAENSKVYGGVHLLHES